MESCATRGSLITLTLLIVVCITAAGCRESSVVELTMVNSTDEILCYQPWVEPGGPTRPPTCEVILLASDTTSTRQECGGSGDASTLRVVLTVGFLGPRIYNGQATCDAWTESGAEIIIDEEGGEFLVTDSLPDVR
jgi:hypothetical protein